MASAGRQRFSSRREIAEEHSAIRVILSWVEAEFARPASAAEKPDGDHSLLEALEAFGEHLQRHFAFEERGGFLRTAILGLPDGQARFLEWRQQHVDLLQRLQALHERLRASVTSGDALDDDFRSALRALLHDLREHEAREGRLLGEKSVADSRTLCEE